MRRRPEKKRKTIMQHIKTMKGPLAFDESGELRSIEEQHKLARWKETPESQPPAPGMPTVEEFFLGKRAAARVEGDWLCALCNVAGCSLVNGPDRRACYRCGGQRPRVNTKTNKRK